MRSHEEKLEGLVQVYTGAAKGKTTAALGLALRAAGQGMKVVIIQFIKGGPECGEHLFAQKHHTFDIVQLNEGDSFTQTLAELRPITEKTLAIAEATLQKGDYDVVILDEIFIARSKGLITTPQILALMAKKPAKTELVLTGRDAPKEVIDRADLVTEMVAVKHPFDRGVRARRGIEY